MVDPAALLWMGLIALFILQCRRKHYLEAAIVGGLVVLLTVFGGTSVTEQLLKALERPYYSSVPLSVPEADVVVVLGGHLSSGDAEPHGFDAGYAFDRVIAGVELIRAGKGKLLLLGGGAAGLPPNQVTEYSLIEPWISRWNLSDVPVEHIGLRANTYEEAEAVKEMMDSRGWTNVTLVTSAWHMKRSEAVFRTAGVNVQPVACDFLTFPSRPSYLIPQTFNLVRLNVFIREKIGWAYYRARGWITD